jgi:hypothetical protein
MTKKTIFFLFFLNFLIFFFLKIRAEQILNCAFPSRCHGESCYLGLPNNTKCASSVSVGLSQIEGFLGYRTRLPVELDSLNQFCKQYTGDESAWALSISIHNYCNGCDQYLAYWTGSGWSRKQVCAGTLNVQGITCATRCGQNLYVDLKVNNSDGPVEIFAKNNILLSWQTKNALSCEAFGDWTGSKNLSGSETIFLEQARQYSFSLKCKDISNKEIQDTVRVNVKAQKPIVVTKPVVNTY